MIEIKLNSYFEEMNIHIQKLNRAIGVLQPLYPIYFNVLEELDETQKEKLEAINFLIQNIESLIKTGQKIETIYKTKQ